jgi:hypothetical protein
MENEFEKKVLTLLVIAIVLVSIFLISFITYGLNKYGVTSCETDRLKPRCYEDVNDRTCRDVDSNTRECWNVPRRVLIDCDVNVATGDAKEVQDE